MIFFSSQEFDSLLCNCSVKGCREKNMRKTTCRVCDVTSSTFPSAVKWLRSRFLYFKMLVCFVPVLIRAGTAVVSFGCLQMWRIAGSNWSGKRCVCEFGKDNLAATQLAANSWRKLTLTSTLSLALIFIVSVHPYPYVTQLEEKEWTLWNRVDSCMVWWCRCFMHDCSYSVTCY